MSEYDDVNSDKYCEHNLGDMRETEDEKELHRSAMVIRKLRSLLDTQRADTIAKVVAWLERESVDENQSYTYRDAVDTVARFLRDHPEVLDQPRKPERSGE